MSRSDQQVHGEIAQLEFENVSLREKIYTLRQFIDSMQNLIEAAEQPLEEAKLMKLLSEVLGNALQTVSASDGSLLVLDEDSDQLVFAVTQGEIAQEQLAWQRLPPGEGIAGWVANNRRATIVNDARADERFYSTVDLELGFKTQTVLAAPIIGGGCVLGVIEMINKKENELFSAGDQTLLTLLCRFSGELLYTVIRQNQEQD